MINQEGTNTQADIANNRLNWPWGRFSENIWHISGHSALPGISTHKQMLDPSIGAQEGKRKCQVGVKK